MLSKRSIRGDYVRQITISFVALLVIFSVALYSYLYFTAYGNIKQELQKYSQHILTNNIAYTTNQSFYIQNTNILSNDTKSPRTCSKSAGGGQSVHPLRLRRRLRERHGHPPGHHGDGLRRLRGERHGGLPRQGRL